MPTFAVNVLRLTERRLRWVVGHIYFLDPMQNGECGSSVWPRCLGCRPWGKRRPSGWAGSGAQAAANANRNRNRIGMKCKGGGHRLRSRLLCWGRWTRWRDDDGGGERKSVFIYLFIIPNSLIWKRKEKKKMFLYFPNFIGVQIFILFNSIISEYKYINL